jgi:hypothetical protein
LTLSGTLLYISDIEDLMSDGPHRSLPMKPKWRSVAERAYNGAFELDEISAAMVPAVARDCDDEMSPRFIERLRGLCEQRQPLLFRDDVWARLEALRQEAGTGMGRRVLENVMRLSKQEEVTVITAVKAIERAAAERLSKSNRQIEEHTLRKATVSRATDVRTRLEQAAAKTALAGLARQVLKLDNSSPARSAVKRAGIDEGPSIK